MLRSLSGLRWLALSGLLHVLALAGVSSGTLWGTGASREVPAPSPAHAGAARGAEGPGVSGEEPGKIGETGRATPREGAGATGPPEETPDASAGQGARRAPRGDDPERASPGENPQGASASEDLQRSSAGAGSQHAPPGEDPQGASAGATGLPEETPDTPAGQEPRRAPHGNDLERTSPGEAPQGASAGDDPERTSPSEDPQGQPAPPRPTGRLALMALGTHRSYATGPRSRYDLVVVSPEKSGKAVLKRAREAHPEALVFAYLNTMDVMLVRSPERPSFWKKREDWFLHDADGERVRVRVQGYKGPRARYGMNTAHPGWQRYLGARAVDLLEMGYDGVQLDNVETDCSYRLHNVGRWISALPVEMTEERWYRAEVEMLGVIRKMADEAGFPDREIIFNHIRAGEPQRSMDYLAMVDGANAENWMNMEVAPEGKWGWRSRVDLIRRAGEAGKRTNLIALAAAHSPEEALFAFASYLMAHHGQSSTFWYGRKYRAEEVWWYWFYDAALGEPAGEMEEVGSTGVFRRAFTRGLVLVNPRGDRRRVTLEPGFMDEAFEPVGELELRPREGKLLFSRVPRSERIVILEAERCAGEDAGGAGAGFRIVTEDGWSSGKALELGVPSEVCRFDVALGAGAWRIVVEGRGQGPRADAALVSLGGLSRRAAFGYAPRQVFEVELENPVGEVTLRAAEAGVLVDRIVLIPVERAR